MTKHTENKSNKEGKNEVGEGWSYFPIEDLYKFNNGEFTVAGDMVRQRCLNLGRKFVKDVHLIPNLNWIYREFFGYDNDPHYYKRDVESRKKQTNQ